LFTRSDLILSLHNKIIIAKLTTFELLEELDDVPVEIPDELGVPPENSTVFLSGDFSFVAAG